MSRSAELEHLLRPLAPEVLGLLVRRYSSFDACEDAVQEARAVEADLEPPAPAHDDTLALLFLCCHQSLTAPSQIALTLRAVGGLTTAEIASAFLGPEATMAQRISRAKATIKASEAVFELPADAAAGTRLGSVLHVLYLIFNEGYSPSSGARIQRVALAEEAIRLTRMLQRLLPDDDEVRGLLALMLLTHARRRRTHRLRRRADSVGRAGPRPVGPGGDRRGSGPGQRRAVGGHGRSVPAPGRDRRRSCRGAQHR